MLLNILGLRICVSIILYGVCHLSESFTGIPQLKPISFHGNSDILFMYSNMNKKKSLYDSQIHPISSDLSMKNPHVE